MKHHNQFTPKHLLVDDDAPQVCRVCGLEAPPRRRQNFQMCRWHYNEYMREYHRRMSAARRARALRDLKQLPYLSGRETTPEEVIRVLIAGGFIVKWCQRRRCFRVNGVPISNRRLVMLATHAPKLQRRHGWWEHKKP